MTKVYVIGDPSWHDDFVQKVFSSRKKALEHLKEKYAGKDIIGNSLESLGYSWEDMLEELYEYDVE